VHGLVSTIVPVYNRPALLREAVGSVLCQTRTPIEVVIVDDGSTDETPAVCAMLASERPDAIRVARIENSGPGAARETGRLLARGEFVQYLDSDDLLHPARFERLVGALESQPAAGAAYSMTREYPIGQPPSDVPSARTGEALGALFPYLLGGRCWRTLSPLYRRTTTDAVGPWSRLRQEEDWEYDARVAALGTKLVWWPEFLADVRTHAGRRASGGSLGNPEKMRGRCTAHRLIYQHARRFGIGPDEPHMRHFARRLFLLARQCGASGLSDESRELFELAREASGDAGNGLDFRLYRAAAGVFGWSAVGRLACWSDRFRSNEPGVARGGFS
jgi:glycosyltransferase involved in cell wall biosynthesis